MFYCTNVKIFMLNELCLRKIRNGRLHDTGKCISKSIGSQVARLVGKLNENVGVFGVGMFCQHDGYSMLNT